MVLYKRKRVTFVRPAPVPADLSTQIFVIPQTKEWFLEYEDYLARLDYYNRRKFVCEITGNSCLTFFEAYDSELHEIEDLEKNFPEALREHILKFLQFNRISRLDLLVDKVYLVFKNEYFPGEEVHVKKVVSTTSEKSFNSAMADSKVTHSYISTVKHRGTIREKVQYSNPSDTKYLVSTAGDGTQIIATNQQISRDRNHFTKWLIKTYVKLTVTRSHKVGAPWVVKEKYAKKYNIPKEYPEDLKHFESITPSGEILYEGDDRQESPAPAAEIQEPKQKKPRKNLKKQAALNAANAASMGSVGVPLSEFVSAKAAPKTEVRSRFPPHHLPTAIQNELEANELATISQFQPSRKTIIEDMELNFDLQSARPAALAQKLLPNAELLNTQAAQRLKELPGDEGSTGGDPNLQKQITQLERKTLQSTQEAMECWIFLNIYHSVLKLDTFTFDDFMSAMGWNDEQYKALGRCELLDEIWCAVLSLVISNDIPTTKQRDKDELFGLQITLPPDISLLEESNAPEKGEEEDEMVVKGSDSEHEPRALKIDDDGSDADSSSTPPPQKLQKKKGTKKKTNGVKEENENNGEQIEDDEPEEEASHWAYSVMDYRGTKWTDRLRKRTFKDGLWQTILLGVLSLVEYVPEYALAIEEAFQVLAPLLIKPATPSTVLSQFYTYMSLDLRLKILHILTSLVVNGNAVRNYIDDSLDSSILFRRSRLDTIRDLKAAIESANKAHFEIYNKLMEAVAKTDDTSLWSSFSRKKHRLNTKGYEMTEYEKKVAEADSEFETLWQERETHIAKIRDLRQAKKDIEMKLSELDCQRVRLLGKDRHYNRYWWFENNGLPNLHFSREGDDDEEQGDPESEDELDEKLEIQEETYLMGRLWIQGPSLVDSMTILNKTPEEARDLITALEADETNYIASTNSEETELASESQDLEEGGQTLSPMDFTKRPKSVFAQSKQFGVEFTDRAIAVQPFGEVIDKVGGLVKDFDASKLSIVQRKFIEETHIPLFLGQQWRYFDKSEDIEAFIKWLNPWGKRESGLRKEFLRVKEGMMASISARRKALWLDKLPKEETLLEVNLESIANRMEELKKEHVEESEAEELSDESRKRPKRASAGPNKRRKTTEETIKTGTLEELTTLREELLEEAQRKVSDNQISRALEWVNRSAIEQFDKLLYEGGDKGKPKEKKSRR